MGSRGRLISHLVSALVFITCLAMPVVAEDTVTITISRIAGAIELFHPDGTNGRWVAALEGQKVGSGWQLRTGSGSKVELLLPKDNTVILRENSVLYIDWLLMNGGARLRTDDGGLLVDIKAKLSPGSEFQIKSPSALAVVRGTKFAVVCLPGGAAAFYGYRGKVEIQNEQGQSFLTAGTTVDVKSMLAPSPAQPSGPDADAFLKASELASDYRSVQGAGGNVVAQLGQIERGLEEAASTLSGYEADWQRFAKLDKQARLVYTYSALKGLRYSVDSQGAQFQALLSRTDAGGLWQKSAQVGARQTTVGGYAERLQHKFSNLYSRFEGLERSAAPVISANTQLLTRAEEARPQKDAATWVVVDTDADGVSDADETALGLDPLASNTAGGFLALSGPQSGTRLEYPAADAVEFSFTPLRTTVVKRYRLVLQCGDYVWQRANIGADTKVPLTPLIGPEGMFNAALDGTGVLNLVWYVVAELDQEQLLQKLTATTPNCAGLHDPALMSAKRTLVITTPTQSAVVVLDLSALDGSSARVGEKLLVEGRISEVQALGKWSVDVVCDPVLLKFIAGSKGTLAQGSAVYFAQSQAGTIAVTGTAPRGGAGISGGGGIFQLEFVACEPGKLEVLVQGLDLRDILGRKIEANPGNKVEAQVLPGRATPVKLRTAYPTRGKS